MFVYCSGITGSGVSGIFGSVCNYLVIRLHHLQLYDKIRQHSPLFIQMFLKIITAITYQKTCIIST